VLATTRLSQGPFFLLLAAFALFAYPVVAHCAHNTLQVNLPSYPKQAYVQVFWSGPALVVIGLVGLHYRRPLQGMASLALGLCWIGAILYEVYTKN
jgi:uncharacterized membrane protein YiaA